MFICFTCVVIKFSSNRWEKCANNYIYRMVFSREDKNKMNAVLYPFADQSFECFVSTGMESGVEQFICRYLMCFCILFEMY